MLDAIKAWADMNYPAETKQLNSSVLISKNSGWRASAMMEHQGLSDEGY